MAKLDWKVLNQSGAAVAAFLDPVHAVEFSRGHCGKIKYGTWIVWNWAYDRPLPGTSEISIVHSMKKRIREKHRIQLRRQGLDDAEIADLLGET